MYDHIWNRNWCRVTSNDQFSSYLTHIIIEVIIIKSPPHNKEIRNHELGGKTPRSRNPTLSLRFISRDFTFWDVYFILRGSGVRGTVEWRARRRVEFKAKATWNLSGNRLWGKSYTRGSFRSNSSRVFVFFYIWFLTSFLSFCNSLKDFKIL